MANHDTNYDRWVDDRLATLEPKEGWMPNAGGALARLRVRSRARAMAVRRWIWAGLTAGGMMATLFLVPATRACAEQPTGCARQVWGAVFPKKEAAPVQLATNAVSDHKAARPAVVVNGPEQRSYKEAGNPSAPIGVEIYADYECPPCAAFFRDVVPPFMEEYVRTGKVKLVHRDFPLPTHRFAKLAARYADAAGERGYYELAVKQIFSTQQTWKATGDIDTELAKALPPGVMQAVRGLVPGDPQLDETLAGDMAQAQLDHLNQTPSLVIVYKGKRQVVAGALSFALLKSYLDGLEQ